MVFAGSKMFESKVSLVLIGMGVMCQAEKVLWRLGGSFGRVEPSLDLFLRPEGLQGLPRTVKL